MLQKHLRAYICLKACIYPPTCYNSHSSNKRDQINALPLKFLVKVVSKVKIVLFCFFTNRISCLSGQKLKSGHQFNNMQFDSIRGEISLTGHYLGRSYYDMKIHIIFASTPEKEYLIFLYHWVIFTNYFIYIFQQILPITFICCFFSIR